VTRTASQPPGTGHEGMGLPRYVSARAFRELLDVSDRAFRRGLTAGRIPAPDLRLLEDKTTMEGMGHYILRA
jgi:hypothetical protein